MSNPQISEKLLQAAVAEEPGALTRFLQGLVPWLRKKARRLVSPGGATAPMGVSTLTQETALRFSRKISSVRATTSPQVLALLEQIMKNTAKDAERDARAKKRYAGDLTRLDAGEPAVDPKTAEQPPQLQDLAYAELDEGLRVALAKLTKRQCQAFLLHADGLLPAEIAVQMGCKASAASMLVKRAKERLQQMLAEHGVVATEKSARNKK